MRDRRIETLVRPVKLKSGVVKCLLRLTDLFACSKHNGFRIWVVISAECSALHVVAYYTI